MNNSLIESNIKNVSGMLEKMKAEIAKCLPKHLTAEKMTRFALTSFRTVPRLKECTPDSFMASVMKASELGLEPGSGKCYFIPYKNNKTGQYECQFQIGFLGFIDLATRSGKIIKFDVRVAYENDDFDYEYGLHEDIRHKASRGERGEFRAAYAIATFSDGKTHQFDVMEKRDIDQIMELSKSKNKDDSPWKIHYEAMAKKTVIKRLCKYIPSNVELQNALRIDDSNTIEGEITHSETIKKSDILMEKLKSAKEDSSSIEPIETGESCTEEQMEEIHMLAAVKQVSITGYLIRNNAEKLSDLTIVQAQELISEFNEMEDK